VVFLHRADVIGATGIPDTEVLVNRIVVMIREFVPIPGGPGIPDIEGLLPRVKM
jgi:hypothetical protein